MTKRDYALKLKLRDELRRALMTLAANPAASASISSGGGSKSYSNQDIAKIDAMLRAVERDLLEYRQSLDGGAHLTMSYPRYC